MQHKAQIIAGVILTIAITTGATIAQQRASIPETSYVVAFPANDAPSAYPAFARVLGAPLGNSCDTLARRHALDPNVVMLAADRNGEALCLLDDVRLATKR